MVRTSLTGKNSLKKTKQRKSINYEVSETNLNDEGEVISDESEEVELEIDEGGGVERSEDGDSDDTLPVLKRSISNIGGVVKKKKSNKHHQQNALSSKMFAETVDSYKRKQVAKKMENSLVSYSKNVLTNFNRK